MISFLGFSSFSLIWAYHFLFLWILHIFIPLRKHPAVRILALWCSSYISGVIVYAHDLANILLSLWGLMLFLAVFHQGKLLEKLTAVFIFYPIMISVNFLMYDVSGKIFFAVANAPAEHEDWTYSVRLANAGIYAAACLARLLFWLGIYWFLRKPLKEIRLNLTANMWLIVDSIIVVSTIGCFTAIYFTTGESAVIYPLCITAVFSSLGCVCLVAYMSDAMQNAYQLKTLKMRQEYYQDKMKEEERVRAIYHDMKNHLLVLENSRGSEKAGQLARKLRSQIADYEDYVHTGNEFLDIILKDKAEKARKRQIDFSAAVEFHGIDFIEPLDLSALFGNGIDNAMEASEKLPEEQRTILLKAGRVQNFVSVLIENCCVPQEGGKNRRTSKGDEFLHGFGISNMQKTAEKYGGQLTARRESDKFILKILIPVP